MQHLAFCAQGAHGLGGLKSSFRADGVQHAVYREDLGSSSETVMITYLPEITSGRQRGQECPSRLFQALNHCIHSPARALANAQYVAGLLQVSFWM